MDKLDILNRDEFVAQLVKLLENISINKNSTCFAINGVWGSGKSFILDLFEEKLSIIQSEETNTEKYFMIRYNSWKYDYYEEPLIALVSAILSEIDRKTKIIPDSKNKSRVLSVLDTTKNIVLSVGNTMIKERTGINVQEIGETISDGLKEGKEKYKEKNAYDTYFPLNEVIDTLSQGLQEIANEYTIVIIVDELDRCIPEYAIKVLERLHHMTEARSNMITIVAIDKGQLQQSVEHVFGFDNPDKYLEKFFKFEIKLDKGTISELISEKYIDYINLFDKDIFPFNDSIEECLQEIFRDVDIRTQEHIFDKVMLVHKLLYSDPKDYSFMCMELIIAVMVDVYKEDTAFLKKTVTIRPFENTFMTSKGQKPAFSDFFKEKFEELAFSNKRQFMDETIYILSETPNLYGALIYTWYWLHEKDELESVRYTSVYETISNNYKELKKFAEMIVMMK